MSTLQFPIIHLNGTPKEHLLEQYSAVLEAIANLQKAMAQATPHMRDYYVAQDPALAYRRAMDQHRDRCLAVSTLADNYETLATAIAFDHAA